MQDVFGFEKMIEKYLSRTLETVPTKVERIKKIITETIEKENLLTDIKVTPDEPESPVPKKSKPEVPKSKDETVKEAVTKSPRRSARQKSPATPGSNASSDEAKKTPVPQKESEKTPTEALLKRKPVKAKRKLSSSSDTDAKKKKVRMVG